jgi:NADPH:quinone reductase-like Zn-dependent oxidoreductase
MRAWRVHAFGGIPALRLDDVPPPQPAEREVLVRVLAASLNAADLLIARGAFPRITETDLPVTLGCDFVGIVECSGAAAQEFRAGATVCGLAKLGQGSFAEYTLADRQALVPVPHTADLNTYAAIPLAALTAWQGLFKHGALQAGQRVLILGAAGGVGHYAVQMASNGGAIVYASAAVREFEFLRSMGAYQLIDRDEPLEEGCSDMDLVLDLVGGRTQGGAWRVLNKSGALVSAVSVPDERSAASPAQRSCRFVSQRDRNDLERISLLVQTGRLRPSIAQRFAFDQAASALQLSQLGGIRGKIILTL